MLYVPRWPTVPDQRTKGDMKILLQPCCPPRGHELVSGLPKAFDTQPDFDRDIY